MREKLYRLIGTDLTQIYSIGPFLALRLISECGTDMNKWTKNDGYKTWPRSSVPIIRLLDDNLSE